MSVEKGVVSGASAFTYQSRTTGNDFFLALELALYHILSKSGNAHSQLVSFSFSFFVSKPKDPINVFSCTL